MSFLFFTLSDCAVWIIKFLIYVSTGKRDITLPEIIVTIDPLHTVGMSAMLGDRTIRNFYMRIDLNSQVGGRTKEMANSDITSYNVLTNQ